MSELREHCVEGPMGCASPTETLGLLSEGEEGAEGEILSLQVKETFQIQKPLFSALASVQWLHQYPNNL